MARSRVDKSLAGRVLSLAEQAGDEAAAKHFRISTRSVRRYRDLAKTDPELAAVVQRKKLELEAASVGWAHEAAAFMVAGIKKLGTLVEQATVKQMRDVTGAIKIVGELDITRGVLGGGEHPQADRAGTPPQAAQGGAGGDSGVVSSTDPPVH